MKGHNILLSSNCDNWGTPQNLFDQLNKEFKFDLDSCAIKKNAKCKKYFTKKNNGLKKDWSIYKSVFCNPPYSDIKNWVKKCCEEGMNGGGELLLC